MEDAIHLEISMLLSIRVLQQKQNWHVSLWFLLETNYKMNYFTFLFRKGGINSIKEIVYEPLNTARKKKILS